LSDAKIDLTKGDVTGHVLRMVGPFSLAVMALLSAGMVDMWFLGNLKDPSRPDVGVWAIAALTIAWPLTFLGNSANIGLGAGTMSAISRALGQNEGARAKRHAAAAIIFALLVMTTLVTIMLIAMPFILKIYGDAGPEVISMARSYLLISFPGLIIVSVASMCNNTLRAGGEAMLPSSIMILGAVINMILDPFLIYGFGPIPAMEVQGAAIATLCGNIIAAIYGFYLAFWYRKLVDFKDLTIRSFRNAVKIIGAVAIPAMGTNIIVPIAAAVAVAIITKILADDVQIAAFGLAGRLELFSVGLLYALSACIGAISGQNGGAGLTDRVRQSFISCFWISFIWSMFMAVVLALIGPYLASIFNDDPDLVNHARAYFYIVPVTIFGYGFVFISAAGLNALGRPLYGLVYTIIRSLLLYVGFIFIGVVLTNNLIGAFIGIATANLISGLIAIGWTMKKVPMTARKS